MLPEINCSHANRTADNHMLIAAQLKGQVINSGGSGVFIFFWGGRHWGGDTFTLEPPLVIKRSKPGDACMPVLVCIHRLHGAM